MFNLTQRSAMLPAGRGPALMLSLAVSLFWTAVFFPALMSADSLTQWQEALDGHYTNFHPPAMAMLMHATQCVTKSPALFALLQGWLFWLAIYLALLAAIPSPRLALVACGVLTCNPALWTQTVVLWKDVWTAAFSLLAIPPLIRVARTGSMRSLLAGVALLAAAACFRHNAVTLALVPVILAWRHVRRWPQAWKRLLQCGAVALAVVLPSQVINALPWVHGIGLPILTVTQYFGVVSRLDRNGAEFRTERSRFDAVFGPGKFDACADGYFSHGPSADYIYFGDPPILTVWTLLPHQRAFFHDALRVSLRHPVLAMRHRARNLMYLAQGPRHDVYYPYQWKIDTQGLALGLYSSSRLPLVRDRVLALLSGVRNSLLFRHYIYLIWLMVSFAVLARKRPVVRICSLIGLCYFAGLVPVDVSPDWRYMLTPYLCAWVSVFSCALGRAEESAAPAMHRGSTRRRESGRVAEGGV